MCQYFLGGPLYNIMYKCFKNCCRILHFKGVHVFSCFIDFNKAFGTVNFWCLFIELLNNTVNAYTVSLLAYWYSNQAIAMK